MKRKAFVLILLYCLLFSLRQDVWATSTSSNDMEELVNSLYAKHLAGHTLDSLASTDSTPEMQCYFPTEAPASIMNCLDLFIKEKRNLPTDAQALTEVFQEVFLIAEGLSDMAPEVMTIHREKYPELYENQAFHSTPGENWWLSFSAEAYDALIVPFYFGSNDNQIIDNQVYFICMLSMQDALQIWVCADQEIVYEMLAFMQPSEEEADDISSALHGWVSSYALTRAEAEAFPQEEESEEPILALLEFHDRDSSEQPSGGAYVNTGGGSVQIDTIGVVTVTAKNTINLRDGNDVNANIVANAANGQTFDCIGIAPTGWYEIILPNGDVGFVSPKLVRFAAK